MRRITVLALVLLVALAGSILTSLMWMGKDVISVNRFPVDVQIRSERVVGVNVDPGGFHFGSLYAGSGTRRILSLEEAQQDSEVTLLVEGEVAQWVSVPPPFRMEKGESRNVSVGLYVPSGAPNGNFTGTLIVITKKT